MKKILVNAYTSLNFGDDLFLKILFDRYPNVKWVLPKGGKVYKELFKEYSNVDIKCSLIFKIKNKLGFKEKNSIFNKYDAGVYIGGSIFMEIPKWRSQLCERKVIINSFKKEDKPYFILGSNFGPYNEEEFINEYRDLFKSCRDICFRDKHSYSFFKKSSNVRLSSDIVFQIKPKGIKKVKNAIGISLINLENRSELSKYDDIYLNKIIDIIIEGCNRGYNFTLFSFCKHEGDLIVIDKLIRLLNDEYRSFINVVNYDGNIDGFLEKFESMECIIGTRFHSVILSQVFNQGLYPFIYSNKTLNVLKDIGLDKEYCYIKESSNYFECTDKNTLDRIDTNYILDVIFQNKITSKDVFIEAKKQFQELDNYVRES